MSAVVKTPFHDLTFMILTVQVYTLWNPESRPSIWHWGPFKINGIECHMWYIICAIYFTLYDVPCDICLSGREEPFCNVIALTVHFICEKIDTKCQILFFRYLSIMSFFESVIISVQHDNRHKSQWNSKNIPFSDVSSLYIFLLFGYKLSVTYVITYYWTPTG